MNIALRPSAFKVCTGEALPGPSARRRNVNPEDHLLDIDAPIAFFFACQMETRRRDYGRFLYQDVDTVFGKTGSMMRLLGP
jgi:hypothetical protein